VQAIVGALADGILVADGEGRIRLMNDAFRQMFALGPQVTDGTLLETMRDAAVERLLGEALAAGETRRGAITLRRSSETERSLEVVAEPIKNRPGASSGAVILFRDSPAPLSTGRVRSAAGRLSDETLFQSRTDGRPGGEHRAQSAQAKPASSPAGRN
jgi:PAS domain-containing protein